MKQQNRTTKHSDVKPLDLPFGRLTVTNDLLLADFSAFFNMGIPMPADYAKSANVCFRFGPEVWLTAEDMIGIMQAQKAASETAKKLFASYSHKDERLFVTWGGANLKVFKADKMPAHLVPLMTHLNTLRFKPLMEGFRMSLPYAHISSESSKAIAQVVRHVLFGEQIDAFEQRTVTLSLAGGNPMPLRTAQAAQVLAKFHAEQPALMYAASAKEFGLGLGTTPLAKLALKEVVAEEYRWLRPLVEQVAPKATEVMFASTQSTPADK